MSLILEALKRSESERIAKSQDASSLVTSGINAGSNTSERRRLLPYVIAALLFNLVVLAVFLIPSKDPKSVASNEKQATEPAERIATHHTNPVVDNEAVQPRATAPRLTLEMPTRAEVPPPREVKAATALAEELLATPRPEPRAIESVDNVRSDSASDSNNAAPALPAEFAMLDTEEIKSAATAKEAPITLRELDNAGLAERLSSYEINTHIFNSDDPSRSFVLINMQKYREGDTLQGSDFTVAHITNEGVVIDHDTGQVLLSNN